MNIWVNFPMLGKMVKIWQFLVFLKELFFQLISTVLKRFWPGNYKNVFVLVLAHLGSLHLTWGKLDDDFLKVLQDIAKFSQKNI